MTDYALFVTAPLHLESLLAEELQSLGMAQARETRGGVAFRGTLEEAYRICLWSRVGNRVLLELTDFAADSPETLYRGIQQIDWQAHFSVDDTFAVQFQTTQSTITHSQYGALKAKDAIVDQFREQLGSRPAVDTAWPDVRINVYLHRNRASVSLDLSGDSLHRRGYRRAGGAAPLKENLAAAILLRAGWPAVAREGGTLVDPMCGSGTLLIEGAMIAADIAPGLLRNYWGFKGWRGHDPATWQTLFAEAQQRREQGLAHLPALFGYDQDARAIAGAGQNIQTAGLESAIQLECRALDTLTSAPTPDPGLVIVNPPYGERLGSDSDLPLLYRQLGQVLKRHFNGWQVALFTGNPELSGQLQLRSLRRHTLYNGPIECKLFHYRLERELDITPRGYPRPLRPDEFTDNARMLANRLQKNRKQLARWLNKEGIHCYRLYDADMPEYALAIDVYEEEEQRWVHVQEYAPPRSVDPDKARQRLREALGVILDSLNISEQQLFFKVRRRQKGTAQYEKLAEQRHFHTVTENGCRFWVNFEDYLDTGLFLDHRLVRQRIGELASGGEFLNLFAYTGTATVYAAHGGARQTLTVDMSRTYLDWAQRNMQLNGYTGTEHRFVQADCLAWLEEDRKQQFDLIFLDPPSFSSSKRMQTTLDIQRDHVRLIRQCMKRLRKNGILIFSTNLRNFKLDTEALASLEIQDIQHETLPRDFERNPKIHHCWEFRHRSKPVLSLK